MHPLISRLKEGDFVKFQHDETCAYDRIFHVCYVDDQYVYLRYPSADSVEFRASIHTGEMRRFASDSWTVVDGIFKQYCEY